MGVILSASETTCWLFVETLLLAADEAFASTQDDNILEGFRLNEKHWLP